MHRFIHPLVTSPVLLDHCCLEFDFTRISKQFPNNVLRQQLLVSSFKPTDLPCRPLTERQCRCSTGCTQCGPGKTECRCSNCKCAGCANVNANKAGCS